MQLLEFGQRFLNYKAEIKVVNNHNGKLEYKGMFVDCPYRILRFADVVRIELDTEENTVRAYITSNHVMFFNTAPHFIDSM